MITVHTMAYNEEMLMQFFINHYRQRFPNCHIVIYDNESTDNTASIAKENNCEIIPYITNGYVDDQKLTQHKNSCWKTSKTNWVLICDIDEMLDISEQQLKSEELSGSTIIRSEAYNMVNMEDNFDLENIKHGSRCPPYDKKFLFDKSKVVNMNYLPGAHGCNPVGVVKYSNMPYKLYHYNGINIDHCVARHIETAKRMSEINKKNGWGVQYLVSPEEKRACMLHARTYAVKVRDD